MSSRIYVFRHKAKVEAVREAALTCGCVIQFPVEKSHPSLIDRVRSFFAKPVYVNDCQGRGQGHRTLKELTRRA